MEIISQGNYELVFDNGKGLEQLYFFDSFLKSSEKMLNVIFKTLYLNEEFQFKQKYLERYCIKDINDFYMKCYSDKIQFIQESLLKEKDCKFFIDSFVYSGESNFSLKISNFN